MKKFNQMTEKQMSKVNGGFIGLIFLGLGLVAGAIGAGAATVAVGEATKKDK